jgi:hypothetical protein
MIANDTYVVALEGFSDTRSIADLPEKVKRSAMQAVNYAARRSRTRTSKAIREQVNWKPGYLDDRRFTLDLAKNFEDSATITGRFRPTSLATFARRKSAGQDKKGPNGGVYVTVKPGSAAFVKRGFVMRLRRGAQLTETDFNLGLAVRLKPGETIRGKLTMRQLSKGSNVYLLYGPSINQVFRDVADSDTDNIAEDMEKEFRRLMTVKGNF